jgi:Fe-S cluster assembly iron-binding protein IscA
MNITPSAKERIDQTLTDSEYLRIEVNGGGCNGFTVDLSKTDGASENDTLLSDLWLW